MRDIPGYEGLYAVTRYGEVWSIKRNRFRVKSKSRAGYYNVSLSKNGKVKRFFVHRLVMLSYVGKSNLTVNHINGLKDDNRLSNLEYLTQKENINHAINAGLSNSRGENNAAAKLCKNDIINIRKMTHLSQRSIAKKYNVSQTLVGKIKRHELWKHV